MHSFGCDYNNMPLINPHSFGFTRGPYSMSKKCLFNRDIIEQSFNYMEQFFDTYKNYRKFFSIKINQAHEFSTLNSWFTDPKLEKALRNLEKKGHLEDTIVWIYSDHGQHVNFIQRSEAGRTKQMNPFMFVMIPKELDELIGSNLEHN